MLEIRKKDMTRTLSLSSNEFIFKTKNKSDPIMVKAKVIASVFILKVFKNNLQNKFTHQQIFIECLYMSEII